MFCENCGKKSLDAAKFCSGCGRPLDKTSSETTPDEVGSGISLAIETETSSAPAIGRKKNNAAKVLGAATVIAFIDGAIIDPHSGTYVTLIIASTILFVIGVGQFQKGSPISSVWGVFKGVGVILGACLIVPIIAISGAVVSGKKVEKTVSDTETSKASSSAKPQPPSKPALRAQEIAPVRNTYGSKGYIVAGGKEYSFADVIVEGNSMLDKQGASPQTITVFGYVSAFPTIPNDPWESLTFTISGGDIQKIGASSFVTTDTKAMIDVVINPRTSEFLGNEQAFKDIKRALLNAQGEDALVKIEGRFGLYSNTFNLFVGAKSLSIVSAKH